MATLGEERGHSRNGAAGETAAHGDARIPVDGEAPETQPEGLREDKHRGTNEGSGCDKQDEGVLEAARQAKSFTLKELSEIPPDPGTCRRQDARG